MSRHKYRLLLSVLLLNVGAPPARAGWLGDAIKGVGQAVTSVVQGVVEVVEDVGAATGKAAGDVTREVGKAAENTGNAVGKAVDDTATAANKAAQDTRIAAEKAVRDTAKALEKAGQDTWQETRRGGKNIEEAGQAVGHYVEASVKGIGQSISDADRRIREGKFIDAFWHLSMAPIETQEDAAAQAFIESSLLRSAGQLAASVYGGGPYGAAAFAAWLTLKETGNLELAIRVGVLSGASSAAFNAAGKLPQGTALDTVKRAAVTGAIGGAAIAAAGGDEQQVLEGVIRAGAMVLVQDAYKDYTKHDLTTEPPSEPAYCVLPTQANCSHPPEGSFKVVDGKYELDMTKVSGAHQFVGQKNLSIVGESSPLMTSISKIPGMNGMAIFHDKWAMDWDMKYLTIPTIAPAIVITYIGTEAPYQELLHDVGTQKPSETPLEKVLSAGPVQGGNASEEKVPLAVKVSASTSQTALPAEPSAKPASPVPLPAVYETIDYRQQRAQAQVGFRIWLFLGFVSLAVWWMIRRQRSYRRSRRTLGDT